MSYLVSGLIITIFVIMACLMYTRRVSALLALPLMALAIAIVGGIPGPEILEEVINKGSVKLHVAYTTTMFGAVLAELMNRHGIAKAVVRWVAEFAGDNPYILGVVLTLMTALLFSTLGGLGAVIMIGTIILPVMLSIGISAVTAGGLYLFGISLGGMFNLANWALYMDVLSVEQAVIIKFVVPFAFILAIVMQVFLAVELRAVKNIKYLIGGIVFSGLCLFGLQQQQLVGGAQPAPGAIPIIPEWSLHGTMIVLLLLVCYAGYRNFSKNYSLSVLALVTPLVPLVLVLVCKWGILPAFVVAIGYGVLATWRKDSITILTRAIIDGITTVIPAIFLMIGIGMLITAVSNPKIAGEIAPLMTSLVPTSALGYIAVFTLIAPLSLYRGPLSLWGMGSGLVKLMQSSTTLSGSAIMGMLMSVGQVQGICDPTNTHNIWIATYLGTDTQVLLRRTIPYAWFAALCGLVMACAFGFVGL